MQKKNKEKSPFRQAAGVAWQVGYTITVPLIILVIVGRILDKHFNSSPIFILAGIVFSMIISTFTLSLRIKKIMTGIKSK